MPRDGFVPTGFSKDPRDFFPLKYLGGDGRGPTFTLDQWCELLRRIRRFSVSYSLNDGTTSVGGGYTIDNLFGPASELFIDCAIRDVSTCGFAGNDPHSNFGCNYFLYSTNASYQYQVDTTFDVATGGVNSVSSSPGGTPSACTGSFMGRNIPLFDGAAACTGSVVIIASEWWARDDGLPGGYPHGPIWDTATGARLLDPIPPGVAV